MQIKLNNKFEISGFTGFGDMFKGMIFITVKVRDLGHASSGENLA